MAFSLGGTTIGLFAVALINADKVDIDLSVSRTYVHICEGHSSSSSSVGDTELLIMVYSESRMYLVNNITRCMHQYLYCAGRPA